MQMIERVARILTWDDIPEPDRQSLISQGITLDTCVPSDAELRKARLVIEAMRQPSEEMVEAGGTANYGHPRETAVEWAKEDKWDSYAHEAVFLYTAMINAALQEGKETVG